MGWETRSTSFCSASCLQNEKRPQTAEAFLLVDPLARGNGVYFFFLAGAFLAAFLTAFLVAFFIRLILPKRKSAIS